MNEECRMWIFTFSPPKMHILLSPWPSWVPAPLCFTGPSPLFLWMIDKTVINSVVFPPLPPLPHFSCLAFPSSPSTSTGYFRPPVLSVKVPLPRSPSPPGRGYRYAGGGEGGGTLAGWGQLSQVNPSTSCCIPNHPWIPFYPVTSAHSCNNASSSSQIFSSAILI